VNRVLVCGGRDYLDRDFLFRTLDTLHATTPITGIVHGGAMGADRLAGDWGRANGVPVEVFPAEWVKDGRAAGPMRNAKMLASGPNLVVAFPGGRGTADMVAKAKRAGVETIVHTLPGASP
jgi:hypothetical protein